MTIRYSKGTKTILKTIHGFQVIGSKIKISVKVGEKTTTQNSMFKQTTTKEIELEEETVILGKNVEVRIESKKDTLFYYSEFEGDTNVESNDS